MPHNRRPFGVVAILFAAAALTAAHIPDTWDGMQRLKSKKVDAVYLTPQADFRTYNKVLIDPTEVAFRKNWQRDQNNSSVLSSRINDSQARAILDRARDGFQHLFADAYRKDGYQVVNRAGPDVLRLSTAVVNIDVTARDAGGATLVIEARDSLSGQLLGRAVDSQATDGFGPYIRNSVTNSGAFRSVFARWAKTSADGLAELKALSPIGGPSR